MGGELGEGLEEACGGTIGTTARSPCSTSPHLRPMCRAPDSFASFRSNVASGAAAAACAVARIKQSEKSALDSPKWRSAAETIEGRSTAKPSVSSSMFRTSPSCLRENRYALDSTHDASTITTCETNSGACARRKALAARACSSSSSSKSRNRTLVSAAAMFRLQGTIARRAHGTERPCLHRPARTHGANVFEGVALRPDDVLAVAFLPDEFRAGNDTQSATDLGGNRNLMLRGHSR